jgi:hypothetical protein
MEETTHLEYLYVTPHRNSAHRVTDIVTNLYVYAQLSVPVLHPRVQNYVPPKELNQRIL